VEAPAQEPGFNPLWLVAVIIIAQVLLAFLIGGGR
jgi:hypothetical protein